MFDAKISQAALTKEFVVVEKKLHLAVSGRKYNPGKKFLKQKPHDKPNPKKNKAAKTDEPKTDEVVEIPEDKQPSPENLGEPQSDNASDDNDDDSLPGLLYLGNQRNPRRWAPKKTKMKETHKQWTQICWSSFLATKEMPHSRNSQQRNHCGQKPPANNCSFFIFLDPKFNFTLLPLAMMV